MLNSKFLKVPLEKGFENSYMSFYDYKINYNECLGVGKFGTVYAVVPRPENEKGLLSYCFPYIYDYLYRANNSESEDSQKYCVKIYKTTIRVLYENIADPLPLLFPLYSLFEPWNDVNSNKTLREANVSEVMFFKSNSFYSQFKSRVRGKTLKYYIENGFFLLPEKFIMRKSFIDLIDSLLKNNLRLEDVHEKNVMYDEQKQRWEIIDGDVSKGMPGESFGNVQNFLSDLSLFKSDKLRVLFNKFYEIASKRENYTDEYDQRILLEVANYKPEYISLTNEDDFQPIIKRSTRVQL